MSQDQRFLSKYSEEVLQTVAKEKMPRGFSFEEAIENTVNELLTNNPSDPEARLQIRAAGGEVRDYVARFTAETGMGPSFLVGAYHGRK